MFVPLKNGSINSKLMDRIAKTPPIDWRVQPNGDFYYDPTRYVDAVVTPWTASHKQRKTFYVESSYADHVS